LDARLTTLLCKNITVEKSKKSENQMVYVMTSLAVSSKESYSSKRAVLMMMIKQTDKI
jgi:transcriptional regulator of nitric oxide reductase